MLRRIVVAAVTVALLMVLLPATRADAGALLPAETTPSPAPIAEVLEPRLALVPLSRGIAQIGEPLIASVVVDNPTDDPLPAAAATVELADDPLTSTAALDDWLAAGALQGQTQVVEQPALPEVPAGESVAAPVDVAADAPAWADKAPGVYALRATYGELVARSAVVLRDPGAPAVTASLAVLVPLTTQARTEGLLSADELGELTASDGRLTALLDGVVGTSAILAVDPAITASIRALGTTAPESARDWLLRLQALPNPRFALQFGDADVTLQAGAGLDAPLAPTSLEYAIAPEGFAAASQGNPAAVPAPTPTASSSAADPFLPTTDDLVRVTGAVEGVYWPAAGRTGDAVLETLQAWAAQQPGAPASATVVSSATTARDALQAPAVVAGGARVLVYEAAASAALRAAAQTTDTPPAAPLAALSAHVALAAAEAAGPLLLTTGRLDDVTAAALQGAIAAVQGYPGMDTASLADLLQAPPTGAAAAGEPDAEAIEALRQMLITEDRLADYSVIIDDPALMTGPERTAILQLIGAAWAAQSRAWDAALQAHAEQSEVTLNAVSIPQPSTIQLITPEAPLRFYVRNDLPWAVNLHLLAVPDSLRLEVERTNAVRAEPGVNTTVQVPVRARVGNGEVRIRLNLVTPTGQQIGPTRYADVQVRADWEGIGVVALSALVVVLLAAGLARTILRRRRARRQREDDTPDEAPGPESAGGTGG